jgi:hypothetical protein
MRKALTFAAAIALVSTQAFATYIVVLKDGTRYRAKSKWTTVGAKATITLESGQTMRINASDIDVAKSDQVSKLGMGDVGILGTEPQAQQQAAPQQPSLGSSVRLRKTPSQTATPAGAASEPSAGPAVSSTPGTMSGEVLDKFVRAYENVGIFEHDLKSTGAGSMRADLTVDSEDKVFNAISATSFLMIRNAGVEGVQIETIDLFMKTTTGGSSGHFEMTRKDAEALDKKAMTIPDYFVRKVIF